MSDNSPTSPPASKPKNDQNHPSNGQGTEVRKDQADSSGHGRYPTTHKPRMVGDEPRSNKSEEGEPSSGAPQDTGRSSGHGRPGSRYKPKT
jgi:hypothetical protein